MHSRRLNGVFSRFVLQFLPAEPYVSKHHSKSDILSSVATLTSYVVSILPLSILRDVTSRWRARNKSLSGYVKVKVKFNAEQTTKSQRGSRGIALLFL